MSRVITVFGATGAQGGGLARAILADPRARFPACRHPQARFAAARALAEQGAEIAVADLDDPASVRAPCRARTARSA
jgi:uncharacterized protein YbjT (DUF2867 family)